MCIRTIAAVIVGALILTVAPMGAAPAGARVEGQVVSMQLQAMNASVREALDALPREFKVTYHLPPDIQRHVTGRYSGTLKQVLARILDGYNYIVEMGEGGTRIMVL